MIGAAKRPFAVDVAEGENKRTCAGIVTSFATLIVMHGVYDISH